MRFAGAPGDCEPEEMGRRHTLRRPLAPCTDTEGLMNPGTQGQAGHTARLHENLENQVLCSSHEKLSEVITGLQK